MKKLIFICMMMTVLFTVVSCSKESLDKRDEWVGTYSGKATWSNDGKTYTEDVSIRVDKSSSEGKLIINSIFFAGISENVVVNISNDGSFNGSFMSIIKGTSLEVQLVGGLLTSTSISYRYTADGMVTISVTGTKM